MVVLCGMIHRCIVFSGYVNLSVDIFFFNDTATTEIYTLSLHDALPISDAPAFRQGKAEAQRRCGDDTGDDHDASLSAIS